MTVLWYILVGIVVGVIARVILPGRQNLGCLMTIILGALGAFLAGSIGQWVHWYNFPSWIGFVMAIVVAAVLIGVYSALRAKRR